MGLKLFRSVRRKKKEQRRKQSKSELRKNWEKLLDKFGGDPGKLDRSHPKPLSVDPLLKLLAFHADRSVSDIPSSDYQLEQAKHIPKVQYTGKMAEREAQAQKEIERKKKMVAPIYNKGPAAYVGGYDPKDLGKKT